MNNVCPVTHEFKPFDPTYLKDPYRFFNPLREKHPVVYSPEYDLYLVTRYEDMVKILHDRETFLAANSTIAFRPPAPEAAAILQKGFPRKPTFTNADPPRHPKMRRSAQKCLNRERIEKTQRTLQQFVDQQIDKILEKPIADLVEDLVPELTLYAGFKLLGFPLEDTELVKSWCGKRILLTYGELPVEEQIVAAQNLVDFWDYCRKFVRSRQEQPADDLTTDLLELAKVSDDLTVEDVDNMIYSLALASHETTANGILNGLIVVLKNRELWNQLVAEPGLIPNAVEELFRMNSPTFTHRRLTSCDTEIAGVPIPKGATIMMAMISGNHDERQFPDPETLNIHRPNANEHLTFGKYWHFCLGAPLARFEYNLVVERLTQRCPRMSMLPDQEIDYLPIVLVRAPDKLLVRPDG